MIRKLQIIFIRQQLSSKFINNKLSEITKTRGIATLVFILGFLNLVT